MPTPTVPAAGYRTLWRWHFYAGLFVMPFLLILALTGSLYCFQPQIEPLLYPQQLLVTAQNTPPLSADTLLASARTALPSDAVPVSAAINTAPNRSTEFIFRVADGTRQSVYVNPYSGAVLGTLSVEQRLMQLVRMLHRKLLLGKPGELLMELAACWTLVMLGTGIALWWPRAGTSVRAALRPRFALKGRPLWKNLHAVMGIWLVLGALAFVLTGLPWSGSWGKQFKALATSANLGAPAGARGNPGLRSKQPQGHAEHDEHAEHAGHANAMVLDDLPLPSTPWAAGNAPVPHSAASQAQHPMPLARAIKLIAALGVTSGYSIALPTTSDGVYAASYFPADPKTERTIYLDQYSGAVLKDIRYGDYGVIAQAISYGTSLHLGRYFGLANQILCAVISLGLAGMTLTGAVMWWKRKPSGISLGAPSRERDAPPLRGWKTGLVLLGLVFPLMGVTLLAVWLVDRTLFRSTKAAAT
ncbi:PepSY-associated TM helix domain-containing protein [Paraburkholderia bonniea]|uniref:PepSY-associated TM helix domain-containing protein n=1 Tax=Paraburkholderia bonniea TaxID=2152891 RepID=UPI001290A91C|nr:PepSY domain-containing protein [Paraburkholderia bonniea]